MATNEEYRTTFERYRESLRMIHGENCPYEVWSRSPELQERYPNCQDYYDFLSISNDNEDKNV